MQKKSTGFILFRISVSSYVPHPQWPSAASAGWSFYAINPSQVIELTCYRRKIHTVFKQNQTFTVTILYKLLNNPVRAMRASKM